MTRYSLSVLCLLAALGLMAAFAAAGPASAIDEEIDSSEEQQQRGPRCNVLHAVFSFQGVRWFIYGPNLMLGLDSDDKPVWHGPSGINFYVSAAAGVPEDDAFLLENYNQEHSFSDFNQGKDYYDPLYYSGAQEEFEKMPDYYGIDAVYTANNSMLIYFAGCDYAVVDAYSMRLVKMGKMADVGLPCNVDAAWSSDDHLMGYISKGRDLYKWPEGAERVEPKTNLVAEMPILQPMHLCSYD